MKFIQANTSLLRANWKSGLTVALVSLPMSISIGVASGSTPTAGIITAVWAGLIAALFSSSNYNIVGPAGALTAILAAFAFIHGPALLPMVAIVTGIIILFAYLTRLNKYLAFIPTSVIHGFTLGIGILLAFSQLNFALGLDNLPKHEAFISNVATSISSIGSADWPTTIIFTASLIVLFVLLRYIKSIPAVIIVTPIGILLGYLASTGALPFSAMTLADKFPDMSNTVFQIPEFKISYQILSTAVTVAIVAMLETLLCGKVANSMTKTRFSERRELLGLSLANIGSGLAGGLPATAVLARTALNVKSGSTHRMSQGINAVIIGLVSLLFLGFFKFLPLAIVASILVFTAARMIELHHLRRYIQHEPISFWIAIGVAAIMVVADPLIAIGIGCTAAMMIFIQRISHGPFSVRVVADNSVTVDTGTTTQHPDLEEIRGIFIYSIKGSLVYMSAEAHIQRLRNFNLHNKKVILRLGETAFMDSDGADALDEIISYLEDQRAILVISSIPKQSIGIVQMSDKYAEYIQKNKVYKNSTLALSAINTM